MVVVGGDLEIRLMSVEGTLVVERTDRSNCQLVVVANAVERTVECTVFQSFVGLVVG